MKLKNFKRSDDMFTNELTEAMDACLHKQIKYCCTYMYITTFTLGNNCVALRYPGFTAGGVEFDENGIILDVFLYDDIPNVYKDNALDEMKKFIGCRLLPPEFIKKTTK